MGKLAAAKLAGLAALALASGVASASSWDENVFSPEHPHLHFADVASQGAAGLSALIARGGVLFSAPFTRADGAGRPKATQAIIPTRRMHGVNPTFSRLSGPDSSACVSCHNQPFPGGAGDAVNNAFVSEGFESAEFDSTDPTFSNERHTQSMFGDGLVELLAREMTADLQAERGAAVKQAWATGKPVAVDLVSKGVRFGSLTAKPNGVIDLSQIDGIDNDLILRPFGRKGVFASLRQFTINALNAHHGMEASERFGVRWTGTHDFDGSGVPDAITRGDVSALVAWQATLPPPGVKANLPDDWKQAAARGATEFDHLGCALCHVKELPLKSMLFTDPGPYDTAGTLRAAEVKTPITIDLARQPYAAFLKRNAKGEWMIPLFSDLKRHVMIDDQVKALGNEVLAQRFVARDVFMTPRLWGVGSTGPYGHKGNFHTLESVIAAHGGKARFARDAYLAASPAGQQDVIAFLRSMQIVTK